MYTITSEARSWKRCLVAFKSKGAAAQFKRFVSDSPEEQGSMRQKLVIEHLPRDWLIQRCALSSLDIFIYEEGVTYSSLNEPSDFVRSNLDDLFFTH
jgi:hypothetical protein